MLKEHTQVVLKKPLPDLGLEPGDIGIVIHIHGQGVAYEVEFLTMDGHTIGVKTLEAADVRQAHGSAIVHERERQVA
ncbi:DUF4926 domain-containing protein [Diaphorobacter sp. J5-51]|uniref:DUF4926 domain-containing protein n=1 Tax=Diaphorobacter sp. J5-51 TaxID=680496 RepID=UPI000A02C3C6|nr:DUF4926 domain-containing protein [Diaphorobacter sp. J5-51]